MRLITRNDASLVVGLIAGTVVIFQRPLQRVWEVSRDVQDRYQIDLLPALTIFVGVFLFHEARKRHQAKADMLVAATEAAQARMRSEELERLVTFSQAVANALDPATLQQALWRYLPTFTGEREFWLLSRQPDRWEALLRDIPTPNRRPFEDLEALAERATATDTLPDARLMGIVDGDDLCFPLIAGVVVGVIGVHKGAAMTAEQRKALGVAVALVAIAVRNVQLFLETREYSLRDSLTNCVSRDHGLETLDREMERARRSKQPLSILMVDIDQFKLINDGLGHLRGDELLREVGTLLTQVLRRTDVKCRYGGDEFLIILLDTSVAGAQQAAESLRRKIAALPFVVDGKTLVVTASVGIAEASPSENGATGLIGRADHALYQAKREGRNRCRVAMTPTEAAINLSGL